MHEQIITNYNNVKQHKTICHYFLRTTISKLVEQLFSYMCLFKKILYDIIQK